MDGSQRPVYEKVLFLDIDGVLNTYGAIQTSGPNTIVPELADLLAKLIASTDAKIVLISTWRNQEQSQKVFLETLRSFKIVEMFVGHTPTISINDRDEEIRAWLADHPTKRFAILDDNPSAGRRDLAPHFFEVSSIVGLQQSDVDKVIRHLNAQ